MDEIGSLLINSSGAVAVCAIFIWYLVKRDDQFQKALEKLTNAIQDLEQRLNKVVK
jgi:hypothetical protein